MIASMEHKPTFIYAEACNFVDSPTGGTLSFAKQMLKTFGEEMALVGVVTDETECGRWIRRSIAGREYWFYGIGRYKVGAGKPLIPARLTSLWQLNRHLDRVKDFGLGRVFTRTPQFALLLKKEDFPDICFCFAGTSNSVAISRYRHLRALGRLYERRLFRSLKRNASVILASADERAIDATVARSAGIVRKEDVTCFPTRFDPAVFHPRDKQACRDKLGIAADATVLVATGRIAGVKGWRLLVDALAELNKQGSRRLMLLFVGDGEQRYDLLTHAGALGLAEQVVVTGRVSSDEVADYLGSSDLYVAGSLHEGWSNAMLEALGCGKRLVTTQVSGARDLVKEGVNGFIVEHRDPVEMAARITQALSLNSGAEQYSVELSKNYTLESLKRDLRTVWLDRRHETHPD